MGGAVSYARGTPVAVLRNAFNMLDLPLGEGCTVVMRASECTVTMRASECTVAIRASTMLHAVSRVGVLCLEFRVSACELRISAIFSCFGEMNDVRGGQIVTRQNACES